MSELLLRRRNLLMKRQEEEMNIRAVCFKADGEQTVAITKVGSAPAITMQYSYDGVTWDDWDLSALPFGGNTKVYVRGVGNTAFGGYNKANTFTFGTDSYVYVSGVLNSLLDGENEVATYAGNRTFINLFSSANALRDASGLIFEDTQLSSECYELMFYACGNLLYAPELPNIKLSSASYRKMFQYCVSLIKGPSILPTTILTDWCYNNMFDGCKSLVNAPELPAETLANNCYWNMFNGCTSLKSLKCHAKMSASDATTNWLKDVKTSGTFYGHSEYGWSSGTSGVPTTWTFEELTD